jgi:hypothetical protein
MRTSFLAGIWRILTDCIESSDLVERAVYEALYRPFLTPLSTCLGVTFDG